MTITDTVLPGWTFKVEEVSAGVYMVIAKDHAGRTVEMTGFDEDTLIAECKQAAIKMLLDEKDVRSSD